MYGINIGLKDIKTMARLRRSIARFRNVTTFLTTFVIVTVFICLQKTKHFIDETENTAVGSQVHGDHYIHDTRRSLLKFSFRREKLKDALWTAGPIFKNETKLQRLHVTITEKSENIAIKIKKKRLKKIFPKGGATTSVTSPSVTDAPTRPVTTQSDTTPIFTDAPTSPITTESITTPIVTVPGEKEVTTEKD